MKRFLPILGGVLVLLAGFFVIQAQAAPSGTLSVPSVIETPPVSSTGDTADDPAIWVNKADPANSLVIGNEKKGYRLTAYNLAGQVVQTLDEGKFVGNVDVRGDLVAASLAGVTPYKVTTTANGPRLTKIRDLSPANVATAGEGLCLWDKGAPGLPDGLFAINIERATNLVRIHPFSDADNDGLLTLLKPVRQWTLGSEGEGCVVDDATGSLYLSEEDVAIWKYDLNATGTTAPPRTQIDAVGTRLAADAEGLAIADGVLYASAQNVVRPKENWINKYSTATGAYIGSLRVTDGPNSDDCDQTDGLDVNATPLPGFPGGLLVCQDGYNDAPGSAGTQNFKYAHLTVVTPPEPTPTEPTPTEPTPTEPTPTEPTDPPTCG